MPITDLIGPANWDIYKAIMRDAQETFGKKEIVWRKSLGGVDPNGEDNAGETFTNITLEVILQYNAFRTWPVTRTMDMGEQDKENIAILMNYDYLRELGYINANNNFNFNPAADRFVFDGRVHKALGDTPTSQAGDEQTWMMIIVKREELLTGTPDIP